MGLDRLGRKMHSYRQGELKAKDSFTTRASFLYGLQVLVSYFNTLSIVFNVKLVIYFFFQSWRNISLFGTLHNHIGKFHIKK